MCADAGAAVEAEDGRGGDGRRERENRQPTHAAHAIAGPPLAAVPAPDRRREQANRYARGVRIRLLVPVAISLALVLAACGGSSKPSSSPTTPQGPTTTGWSRRRSRVGERAVGVGEDDLRDRGRERHLPERDRRQDDRRRSSPTWVDHVYSCDYVYPGGAKMTLVGQGGRRTPRETTAYFDSLATKLRQDRRTIAGLGQGAFQVRDGSVVVRKDFKILLDRRDEAAGPVRRSAGVRAATSPSTSPRRSWGAGPARDAVRAGGPLKAYGEGAEIFGAPVDNPSSARTNPFRFAATGVSSIPTSGHDDTGPGGVPTPPPRHPATRGRTPAHLRPTGRGGRG